MAVGKMTSVYKQLMGITAALAGLHNLGVENAVPEEEAMPVSLSMGMLSDGVLALCAWSHLNPPVCLC